MTTKEAYLYHQIHPLKLMTDIGAGFGSLVPLWEHQLVLALVVMLIPPPIASFFVMRYAHLEPCKQSALGKYILQYMTHAMEAVRLAGMVMIALGGWYHSIWLIIGGIGVVLLGWMRGKILPHAAKSSNQNAAPGRRNGS